MALTNGDSSLWWIAGGSSMTSNKPRRPKLNVPVNVLVGVQPQAGLGWEWDCKFESCRGRGVTINRDEAYDAGVAHWHRDHRATGGGAKNGD